MITYQKLAIWDFCVVICLLLSATPTSGQQYKLLAPDGAEDDKFGQSVSIWENTAVVGTNPGNGSDPATGNIYTYVFDGNNWVHQQTIAPTTPNPIDYFGYDVDIYQDYLIAGAPWDNSNGSSNGAAYIFKLENGSWKEEQQLLPNDPSSGSFFGNKVSIWGDYAVVAAFRESNINGGSAGSVYVFKNQDGTWIQEAKLLASDGFIEDWFGYSVSIWENRILVGAQWNDESGENGGAAYIFQLVDDSWEEQQKLLPAEGAPFAFFGNSCAIYGDVAIVGATFDNEVDHNSGAAYLFEYNNGSWSQKQKLIAQNAGASDWFGWSVGVWENTAVVGALKDDDVGESAGSIHQFDKIGDTWQETENHTAFDGSPVDWFGSSTAIWNDRIIGGARLDDDNGNESGAAYVLHVEETYTFAQDTELRLRIFPQPDSTIVYCSSGKR